MLLPEPLAPPHGLAIPLTSRSRRRAVAASVLHLAPGTCSAMLVAVSVRYRIPEIDLVTKSLLVIDRSASEFPIPGGADFRGRLAC